jgi:hypothetical protein
LSGGIAPGAALAGVAGHRHAGHLVSQEIPQVIHCVGVLREHDYGIEAVCEASLQLDLKPAGLAVGAPQLRDPPEQIVDPLPFVNRPGFGCLRSETRYFFSGHHLVLRFVLRRIFLGDDAFGPHQSPVQRPLQGLETGRQPPPVHGHDESYR